MKIETISWTGQSLERVEDAALLTGRGRFIDDLGVRPGTLHAAILRSPHAHARILSIDASAARALPGVRAVLTAKDIPNLKKKAPTRAHAVLAIDRVVFMGQPVAAVAADEPAIAEEALDLIKVEYQVLPVAADPLMSMQPGAPPVADAGTEADTSEALAHAAVAIAAYVLAFATTAGALRPLAGLATLVALAGFAGFASPATLTVAGLFVVARAIREHVGLEARRDVDHEDQVAAVQLQRQKFVGNPLQLGERLGPLARRNGDHRRLDANLQESCSERPAVQPKDRVIGHDSHAPSPRSKNCARMRLASLPAPTQTCAPFSNSASKSASV